MTLLTLTTDQLRAGDVILAHGMRCLIDKPIDVTQRPTMTLYYTRALVLNRDDVPAERVPLSFTVARRDFGDADGEHRWPIQGNELAYWRVERMTPDEIAESLANPTDLEPPADLEPDDLTETRSPAGSPATRPPLSERGEFLKRWHGGETGWRR